MAGLVRVALDGGGWLVLEAAADDGGGGPVKAGRVADAAKEIPGGLRAALGTITEASREVLDELRAAGPDEVKVEFGVKLTASAGAVLAKTGTECHLKITVGWSGVAAGDDDAE